MTSSIGAAVQRYLLAISVSLLTASGVTALQVIAPTPASAGTDDYPTQWRNAPMDSVIDTWREYNRECTSFVAFRLSSRNGFEMPFHDNANMWGPDASNRGYAVNMTPAVGAVAWWADNHVAWVESVNENSVTVEEYNNPAGAGSYRERTILASSPSGYIHFKDIGITPPPPASYLLIRQGAAVSAKAGLNDNWVAEANGAAAIQAAGSRIGFVDAARNLYVKDGLNGTWFNEAGDVDQFVLTASLLVIRQGTSISAKAGLNDNWVAEAGGAVGIRAAGTRIAFLDDAGTLYAKDGLNGTWYTEAGGVTDYVLSSNLLIIRQGTAALLGKTGLNDNWIQLGALDGRMATAGPRLAVLTTSGTLWAKDGLNGNWFNEAGAVDDYAISPDMLLIRQGVHILAKAGLNDTWVAELDTGGDILTTGTRIGVRTPDGTLYVKQGLYNSWFNEAGNVSQFILS